MKSATSLPTILSVLCAGLVLVITGCGEKSQNQTAAVPDTRPAAAGEAHAPVEHGVFFKPDLSDFALHNEYDDDGDGDGVKETHVRRYISGAGDKVFSLSTNGILWAWSLDTSAGDDADIHKNFVIRDSNCDGVFDERYSLDAEFHLPACVMTSGGGAGAV